MPRPPARNEGKVGTWAIKPAGPSGERRFKLVEYFSDQEPSRGFQARKGPLPVIVPIKSFARKSRTDPGERSLKYCMACKRKALHRPSFCPSQHTWR